MKLGLEMTHVLERVVRPPVMSLGDVKQWLCQKRPDLSPDPLKRGNGQYHCLEVFGQSDSVTDGYAQRKMSATAFDCSSLLVKHSKTLFW